MRWIRSYVPDVRVSPELVVVLSGLTTATAVAVSFVAGRTGISAGSGAQSYLLPAAIVVVAFLLSSVVTYATSYRRILNVQRQREWLHTDITLGRLQRVYRDEISDCHLRVNVMRVRRWDESESGREHDQYLSIWEEVGDYSEDELDCRYEPTEGCAGTAFHEREPTVYDAANPRHPARRMTDHQQAATDRVKSALSIPIHPDNDPSREPIGVLNLDSDDGIDETKFNTESARSLGMQYAGAIRGHHLMTEQTRQARQTEDGYLVYEYSDEEKRELYNSHPSVEIDPDCVNDLDDSLVLRSILRSLRP